MVGQNTSLKMNRFNDFEGAGELRLPEKVRDPSGYQFYLVPEEAVLWNDGAPITPSLLHYAFYKLFLGSLLLFILPWLSRFMSVEMGVFAGVGFWLYYKVITILGPELYEDSLDRLRRLGPVDERYRNLWWEPLAHHFTKFSAKSLEFLEVLKISTIDDILMKSQVVSVSFELPQIGLLMASVLLPPLFHVLGMTWK